MHFFWDEPHKSGKDVVECVDRLLLENGISPFGAKIVFVSQPGLFSHPFVQQVGRAGSLSRTLKDAASGKIFDLMNDFGETEIPKGQRICKVFGVE